MIALRRYTILNVGTCATGLAFFEQRHVGNERVAAGPRRAMCFSCCLIALHAMIGQKSRWDGLLALQQALSSDGTFILIYPRFSFIYTHLSHYLSRAMGWTLTFCPCCRLLSESGFL